MDEQINLESIDEPFQIEGDFPIINGDIDGMVPTGFDPHLFEIVMPTYKELREAGFSEKDANNILDESIEHPYSDWELLFCLHESVDPVNAYKELLESKTTDKKLFHVMYECDDPIQAYNDMMSSKIDNVVSYADKLLEDIEKNNLLGSDTSLQQ